MAAGALHFLREATLNEKQPTLGTRHQRTRGRKGANRARTFRTEKSDTRRCCWHKPRLNRSSKSQAASQDERSGTKEDLGGHEEKPCGAEGGGKEVELCRHLCFSENSTSTINRQSGH